MDSDIENLQMGGPNMTSLISPGTKIEGQIIVNFCIKIREKSSHRFVLYAGQAVSLCFGPNGEINDVILGSPI